MKKLLSVFLCALLVFTAIPLFAVSADDVTYQSGVCVTRNGYLYNIPEKTTVSAFLNAESGFVSVSSAGNYIATGDIAVDQYGSEYTVIVHGDVNCDGKITVADYILVRRAYLGTVVLDDAASEAAKAESEITALDYLRVKRHVLNTYDIASEAHREAYVNGNGIKVAYIPLDNRPVVQERVIYLAEAVGFDLLIPDEDLYRTALDGSALNSNGTTYGDREALLAWLKSVEDECDYFVISLDQMISGGLVSSRWLSNTDLSLEMEIADYIINLAKTKHVVLYDTVMRLASTANYQGYTTNEYNALRTYGKTARKLLSGSNLTIDNIIAGYPYDANGKAISYNTTYLNSTKLNKYFASRERKLRIIDYILSGAAEDFKEIYIGVDDSSPQTTIQTNEINYITSKAGDNLTLFSGTDELGLMGIASIATHVYGSVDANVTYFGEGRDDAADEYDIGTLGITIEKHLLSMGVRTVNSQDPKALQILVLTKSSSISTAISNLINQLEANIEADIPTCVVNAAGSSNWAAFGQALLAADIDIAEILGFSHWNTVANAIGIATSNAVARYAYIYRTTQVTNASNAGFLKTITFSLIKDISYRNQGISNLSATGTYGPATILAKINSSVILVKDGEESTHGTVSVSNFRYPWDRPFEATFDIAVS